MNRAQEYDDSAAGLFEREALELSAILDTMADGVFVIDGQHVVRRWNQAMTRITGYSREEAIGRPCSFLRNACGGLASKPQPLLDCGLLGGGPPAAGQETAVCHAEGREVPVLANARELHGPHGETLGAVVTLTDLSAVKQLEGEVARLRKQVARGKAPDGIVGQSHRMQEVFELIELAADSPVTVLIQGETGTGKELAARAIHAGSVRKEGPLITVNCSALSESLLESELFGHVRGAFTGAIHDHAGRFERANGGTIFLDEIAEISPVVQVKLLRVLQERELERVGDDRVRKVDVRVIAATNRDLRESVRQGGFREDLFYRLKVFPITLPPLRERKEDIPLLAARFIEQFNGRTGKRIEGLDAEALHIVMDYCWPGNVRELENAVEHAFVTCGGGLIGPFDLPVEIRRFDLKQRTCADRLAQDQAADAPVMRRRGIGREDLINALRASGWNKSETARRLGVTRTSVWRRMKSLGLPLEPPS